MNNATINIYKYKLDSTDYNKGTLSELDEVETGIVCAMLMNSLTSI